MTPVQNCYQCGKCTAGCPVADRMDVVPNQLIRFVQLELIGRAVQSEAIWECVSCLTCSSRCPKEVDCASLMDDLRRLAVRRAAEAPAARRTVLFQKAFLNNIRRYGRLNELELIGAFKTASFLDDFSVAMLFKDAGLAPRLNARGKFHVTGEKVRDRGVVGRIFERCAGEGNRA